MKGTPSSGIQVLIDRGSSDSFIQPRIAKFLNLPVQPTPAFRVMVGNFHVMIVEGHLPFLDISMQGHSIRFPNVYVLTSVDYDALLIKFLHEGKFITIKGEEAIGPQQAQFNHMKRLFHTEVVAEAFSIKLTQPEGNASYPLELP